MRQALRLGERGFGSAGLPFAGQIMRHYARILEFGFEGLSTHATHVPTINALRHATALRAPVLANAFASRGFRSNRVPLTRLACEPVTTPLPAVGCRRGIRELPADFVDKQGWSGPTERDAEDRQPEENRAEPWDAAYETRKRMEWIVRSTTFRASCSAASR